MPTAFPGHATGDHVIKKAGLIVGGALAVLVAASPLAFAADHSPACTFDAAADNSVQQDGQGGDSLAGLAGGAVTNAATITNAQTQAPVDSCNNTEDVLDANIEDNFQDNSQDNDVITETIEDSLNVVD
jgi:hypothetical protein